MFFGFFFFLNRRTVACCASSRRAGRIRWPTSSPSSTGSSSSGRTGAIRTKSNRPSAPVTPSRSGAWCSTKKKSERIETMSQRCHFAAGTLTPTSTTRPASAARRRRTTRPCSSPTDHLSSRPAATKHKNSLWFSLLVALFGLLPREPGNGTGSGVDGEADRGPEKEFLSSLGFAVE